jgi:hypothetical protein
MTRRIKHTELWEVRTNGRRYLLNTITAGSKYHSVRTPKDMHSAESQLEVANELKNGWQFNGPNRHDRRYEIVQVWIENWQEVRVLVTATKEKAA